jgi:hypothetical protein
MDDLNLDGKCNKITLRLFSVFQLHEGNKTNFMRYVIEGNKACKIQIKTFYTHYKLHIFALFIVYDMHAHTF